MMDSSSSNDEPELITEILSFDENTFIVDGQTISLADFEQDPLDPETLLSPSITLKLNSSVESHLLSPKSEVADEVVGEEHKDGLLEGEGEIEEEEEEDEESTMVPLIVKDAASSQCNVLEAHVLQLDGGMLAYIHPQPQDGSQAVELEDGTVAYITLTQPIPDTPAEEPKQPKKPKSFMCPQEGCGRLYTSSHHLKVHERTHTGSRPYNCTVEGCNKAFSTDYSRKAHIRTHTGEKPYKCPEKLCPKSFKTSGDLQKHIRTHTGERPFICPVEGCNRSFTTSNIRKVHIRTHTGERPYVCNQPYCDKAFASATNYKNHIRIHSGEKPYVCTVDGCNKRFTEYSSLYKHHLAHSQDKPYQCGECGRSYRQGSTLTVHRRTAHGLINAEDGTEILLGDVLARSVLRATSPAPSSPITDEDKTAAATASLFDGDYILDSGGSIQRISSEQIFIIEDSENLRALQHITDPDDEELQAALDPLQEEKPYD